MGALAATCTASSNCENNQCDTVGGTEICMSCQTGNVPINGQCTAKEGARTKCTDASGNSPGEKVCAKYLLETFMYKGGCYGTTATPGSAMCKTADAGKCTEAAETKEYFVPPGADASHDSVVSCGDTAGVTFGSGSNTKTYKGVDGCAKCTAPDAITDTTGTKAAACTECTTNLYLKTKTSGTSCVASDKCTGGFFPMTDNSKKLCTKCNATGKGGVAECTACVPRTDNPTKAKCTACSGSKKPSLDGTSCNACTDTNCASCASGGACQKCISGYILDGAACTQQTCSTPDCKTCTNPKAASEACTTCAENKYLTPTSQCIADCTALSGYYGDAAIKTCKRCDPSCAE